MSTNKTENLNLHSWTRDDAVKMEEFNENFSAIDAAVGALRSVEPLRIAEGSYAGDGTSGREITVGFRPKLLLLQGRMQDRQLGCLVVRGEDFDVTVRDSGNVFHDQKFVEQFTDTGFVLSSYNLNLVDYTAHYFAFG